jgi:dTDP-4-dehydrorhamnose 3,5-epimerase-like enzyme
MEKVLLPRGVRKVQLPHNVDERGHLTFLEGNKDIPFEVKRVFWIFDVPKGKTRGGHAHWSCHEVVFPVSGSFEIELDDGERCVTLVMDDPTCGVTIPAGVWCELRHFEVGTVCVVMASEEYDVNGYAFDRESWKERLNADEIDR